MSEQVVFILGEIITCRTARLENIPLKHRYPTFSMETEVNTLTAVHRVNMCPSASDIN